MAWNSRAVRTVTKAGGRREEWLWSSRGAVCQPGQPGQPEGWAALYLQNISESTQVNGVLMSDLFGDNSSSVRDGASVSSSVK